MAAMKNAESSAQADSSTPSEPQPPQQKRPLGRVAVIGAGVSGLAAAYRLQQGGAEVVVFDQSPLVGGLLRTFRSPEGFLCDLGANSMVDDHPRIHQTLQDLGLDSQIALPQQANKRYVMRDGRVVLLPTSPWDFLTTPVLSTPAKLRLLAEPFLWKPRRGGGQGPERTKAGHTEAEAADPVESVKGFLERHVGKEAVDYVVDPFCGGTMGAPPESLGMKFTFPSLWKLEQLHGSLVMGSLLRRKEDPSSNSSSSRTNSSRVKGSFSFSQGMQTLPLALAQRVGLPNLLLDSCVTELTCDDTHVPRPVWRVSVSEGESKSTRKAKRRNKEARGMRFDAVIVTVPLRQLRAMKISVGNRLWDPSSLPLPQYCPFSVVVTAFPSSAVRTPLPGFGVLIPSLERNRLGLKTLGTIFSSSLFPTRAPPGYHLFTSFVGGAQKPELAALPDQDLVEAVTSDLRRILGVTAGPAFARCMHWNQAFPLYGLEYGKVLKAIEDLQEQHPFLYYAGNHCGSLAVGKTLLSGLDSAEKALENLRSHGGAKLYTMA